LDLRRIAQIRATQPKMLRSLASKSGSDNLRPKP
jgi:hypothetical protein